MRSTQRPLPYQGDTQPDQLTTECLSIAAHQLRTPLTAIRSYLWLCVFRPICQLPEEVLQHLHTAYLASERSLELIKEFLTTSQLEAGKLMNIRETHQLRQVIEQLLHELTLQAQHKRIRFSFKNLTTNSSCQLDRTLITEALQNLLSNAIKFSPPDAVVSVVLSANTRICQVSVTDQGPGITQADQKKLFRKFAVIKNSYQNSSQHGTGLGLYIAQQFARLHGGHISVSSQKGKGSTFTLIIPRSLAESSTNRK